MLLPALLTGLMFVVREHVSLGMDVILLSDAYGHEDALSIYCQCDA